MFIEEVIIDGFKSYATRTVISGFDECFNAITGLNGSGKSNILDAICFVLGITNLSQVRASNLQELVYKQGQAGVMKASVTIVFNNAETKSSPVGYEQYDQITVCRQVVIGGRNKYLINGHSAQANQVQNLFHSVQLNVNNPHFLIMQGRITKVLNMKPPEILGMIEEAAGTRMYENKKQGAVKTMEKKQKKVDEINKILADEITPTLEKLRGEKSHYLKWAANNTEMERLERFCVAHEFMKAEEVLSKSGDNLVEFNTKVEEMKVNDEEIRVLLREKKKNMEELAKKKEREMTGEFLDYKTKEEETGKELVRLNSIFENRMKSYNAEVSSVESMKKQLKEVESNRSKLKSDLEASSNEIQQYQKNANLYKTENEEAQKQLQALSAGIATDGDGDSTLSDQLSQSQRDLQDAKTAIKQIEMKTKHVQSTLKEKEKVLNSSQKEQSSFESQHEILFKEIVGIEKDLNSLKHNPSQQQQLLEQKEVLENKIQHLQNEVDELSDALSGRLNFDYTAPSPNFDASKVKGVIAKLVSIKDASTATALEISAGGKLYHVVVDNETTGKELLKKGKLKTRVTIVPLNKISRRTIGKDKIRKAKSLCSGSEEVNTALELVCYPEQVAGAMEYAFGSSFVCNSIDLAKKVTFHPDIKIKSVTLEGDSFDPAGTLQGGSAPSHGSILAKIQHLNTQSEALGNKKSQLQALGKQLEKILEVGQRYEELSQELELKRHEMAILKNRMDQSAFGQLQKEVNNLREESNELIESFKKKTQEKITAEVNCKKFQDKIQNMQHSRDSEMKRLENEIKNSKKQAQNATNVLKEKEQALEVIKLEIQQTEEEITSIKDQIISLEASIVSMKESVEALKEDTMKTQRKYEKYHTIIEEKKKQLTACDDSMKILVQEEKQLNKTLNSIELELKKFQHKITRLMKDQEVATSQVEEMLKQHPWIESEKQFFGRPQTDYCFQQRNPDQAKVHLRSLREEQGTLSKKINKKVMGMIEKAEQEYQELMSKREIIENDKSKIQSVIKELDAKKNEALQMTWVKVNRDFGSIFSTLLPGTSAKLDPPEKGTILDGLCVRVAFGNVWKESLTELSGGQRSLLALSLILSLLLFKPAPMYILDEVDAALDLSHTQNIGQMIKSHFKHSQFIVVSLKEGMFNNANVVFRTKFVDGVSTVTRTTPGKTTKKNIP